MGKQTWVETLIWATSDGAAVANTTTETILFPDVPIPAYFMADGRCLRLKAYGKYGTTSTPTMKFQLRWGGVAGTVIAATGAFTSTSGTGGGASMTAVWNLEAYIQVRSNGSAGTVMANGEVMTYTSTQLTAGTVTNYGQPTPLVSGSTGGTTPVATAVDLTTDKNLSLTITWGTANAANSIQGLNYIVEALN